MYLDIKFSLTLLTTSHYLSMKLIGIQFIVHNFD